MKAIVVDVNIFNAPNSPMSEMENLLKSLDISIDFVCSQKLNKPNTNSYIGKGLLLELKEYVKENNIPLVVFNNDLTPLQIRYISDVLEVEVYDRSMIILKIFEIRAYSKEARLQVEVAYLKYMASRLIEKDKNYSQVTSGGAGGLSNKGAGEKAIDIKKYLIKKRIKEKEDELVELVKTRINQRQGRSSILPKVSLVGYTNAGKSTLMNLMIKNGEMDKKDLTLQEDRLFATLSTTTRLIKIKNYHPFLLTDTVGFISNLPHSLIKAFRSTLEEIKEADLLIHVVDLSSPNFLDEIKTTNETLLEIGVKDKEMIYVFNKIDKIEDHFLPFVTDDQILVSLNDSTYLDDILRLIEEKLSSYFVEVNMFIPYEKSDVYFALKKSSGIKESIETDLGYKILVSINRVELKKYKDYLVSI